MREFVCTEHIYRIYIYTYIYLYMRTHTICAHSLGLDLMDRHTKRTDCVLCVVVKKMTMMVCRRRRRRPTTDPTNVCCVESHLTSQHKCNVPTTKTSPTTQSPHSHSIRRLLLIRRECCWILYCFSSVCYDKQEAKEMPAAHLNNICKQRDVYELSG